MQLLGLIIIKTMFRNYSKRYNALIKTIKVLGLRIPKTLESFNELHTASIALDPEHHPKKFNTSWGS
ncbi:hypothetical protein FF125_09900 [Aureibaculum algae]|uniref:Uncharacterized protein n=1 Tax=Aureibaculum algae TaxID=2584122 RepID=A0A5B7TR02_9FLAO|nr:hypothetical protein [Aureibaculum algae]QCX38730.1 hypothetical protein FF125_09900 [Aureibaculum algae]